MSNISGSCECETQQHTLKNNESDEVVKKCTYSQYAWCFAPDGYTHTHTHSHTHMYPHEKMKIP